MLYEPMFETALASEDFVSVFLPIAVDGTVNNVSFSKAAFSIKCFAFYFNMVWIRALCI